MRNVILSLLAIASQQAKQDFVRQTQSIQRVQKQFLRSLLHHHRNTELGQKLGLGHIKTLDQFRQQVPVQPYSFYEPYIERSANGESNLLTPDPIVFFNMTSGSTGKRKLIPVTRRSRNAVERASRIAMGFAVAAAQRRGLPLGKMLFTSPATTFGQTPSGVPYGPISTSGLRLMPAINRSVLAYPFEALLIADMATRHYVCLLFALRDTSLGIIGATFPVLGLQLAGYLEEYGTELIRDLETGELAPWLDLDPALRQTLQQQWSAHPQRAAELRQILIHNGRLTPKLAFPHLSFIVTARGGTSNFYLERFPDYFGNTPVFGGTYTSAETVFGIHRDFDTNGAILAISSGFYEFVPEDQWEVAQPKTLLPWEVKVGDRYRILITNYSGFYRYDIGDVVEVEGFFNQTPLIIFCHRRGGVISSTTEKTTEFHVTQVMQALQQEFNIALENFCITLSEDVIPPHYLVNIELVEGQSLDNPVAFLQRFDDRLKEFHLSYAIKRRDQVPPPRLRILAAGSFEQVRQRMIQRGATETQLKFPLVSEDRSLLSELAIEQEIRLEKVAWLMQEVSS